MCLADAYGIYSCLCKQSIFIVRSFQNAALTSNEVLCKIKERVSENFKMLKSAYGEECV
jgi:hypothetical protein